MNQFKNGWIRIILSAIFFILSGWLSYMIKYQFYPSLPFAYLRYLALFACGFTMTIGLRKSRIHPAPCILLGVILIYYIGFFQILPLHLIPIFRSFANMIVLTDSLLVLLLLSGQLTGWIVYRNKSSV